MVISPMCQRQTDGQQVCVEYVWEVEPPGLALAAMGERRTDAEDNYWDSAGLLGRVG